MRALPLVLLLACSEYDLSTEGAPLNGVSTPSQTDATVPRACPTDAPAGFDANVNESCTNEVETGTFDPVVKWSTPTFADGGANNVMMTPIVTTLNDDNGDGLVNEDDVPDIVFIAYGGFASTVRALSGANGAELWAYPDADLQMTGGVAAGDLDNNGRVEIVAMANTGIILIDANGQRLGKQLGLAGHISGTSDVPAISDMDHDGKPEIIAGNAVLSNTGTVVGLGTRGIGGVGGFNVGSCSFADDVDGDGQEEVVTGNALYRRDGSTIWSNGLADGYPAVADFDGDGQAEIVAAGQGEVRLIDTDGTLLWSRSIPGADATYYAGPPTVADFDGDGAPEIGVAAGSRYSVFEADGTLRWQSTTDDSSSGNTGSAVFDFEGDGAAEVVYADQTKLWVFSGVDGSVKLASSEHSNGTWLEYPVIADVDADGHAEIVVPQEYQYGGYTGITVFEDRLDSWQPGRRTWNQHAYSITHVNDDGTIPVTAAQNWRTYNSFRSGDLTSGDGTDAPDLAVSPAGICEALCPTSLTVWAHPGNEGLADVAPGAEPTLSLWAETTTGDLLLETVALTSTLTAGRYQDALPFEVSGLDWSGLIRLRFEIGSQELDCDPSNNVVAIEGPFCEEAGG